MVAEEDSERSERVVACCCLRFGRAYDMIPMVVLQDFLLFVSLSSVIQPLDYFLPPRSNLTKHQRTPTDSRHTYQPC